MVGCYRVTAAAAAADDDDDGDGDDGVMKGLWAGEESDTEE